MSCFTLIHANDLPTGDTILSIEAIKAGEAVWLTLPHDVPQPSQPRLALLASKVLHMPGSTLSLCAFIAKDDFITG